METHSSWKMLTAPILKFVALDVSMRLGVEFLYHF